MKHPLITVDSKVMFGKPCIRGTRLPVAHVLHYLAMGMSLDEYLQEFPSASREGVLAAVKYAAELIDFEGPDSSGLNQELAG